MEPFFNKNGYAIYACPSCGLKATRLPEDYETFVQKFYNREYYNGEPSRAAYTSYRDDKPFIEKNHQKILNHIARYKKNGKLLDVGCAMGYLVKLALGRGYDAYGFDPSSYAVGEGKRLKLDGRLTTGTIQGVSYAPGTFDIVTMLDVIEHVPDPADDIGIAAKLLKASGFLVIATGDTDSFFAGVLRRRWTFYSPPQHLFFFNRKTLGSILLSRGFRVIETFRIGKWVSLQYLLHLARTNGESRIAGGLYTIVGNLGIGRIPLYMPIMDNMVVIAQKQGGPQRS